MHESRAACAREAPRRDSRDLPRDAYALVRETENPTGRLHFFRRGDDAFQSDVLHPCGCAVVAPATQSSAGASLCGRYAKPVKATSATLHSAKVISFPPRKGRDSRWQADQSSGNRCSLAKLIQRGSAIKQIPRKRLTSRSNV